MDGRTNAEIATILEVSTATVKKHLRNTMIRWSCRNRVEVVAKALRDGGCRKSAVERRRQEPFPQ